ncbi:MAG: DUF359 domain-containing protein [Desulfurococcales archaeon]|nr:DUF359 domain-containing protein [Desulfurococcales archaeon]
MNPALILPTHYRRDFAKPRAPIVSGDFSRHPLLAGLSRIACIGDIVSRYCINGIEPKKLVLIVDGKTRRYVDEGLEIIDKAKDSGMSILHIENPPGTITMKAILTICKALSEKHGVLIVVKGEEDMLALPAIACTQENQAVIYGVPGQGATIIRYSTYTARDAQLRTLYLKPGTTYYRHNQAIHQSQETKENTTAPLFNK